MADGYAHFQQAAHPFTNTSTQQRLRRGTPPQTPSPSRSPAPQSPGNFAFYAAGHAQMMTPQHRGFIPQPGGMKYFQTQMGQQHVQQVDQGLVHAQNNTANNGAHHNYPGGGVNAAYSSPQHASLSTAGPQQHSSVHWSEQQQLVNVSRQSSEPHHHARQAAVLNKNAHATVAVAGGVNPNTYRPTDSQHRKDGPTQETIETRNADGEVERQDWRALDLGGQGLLALSSALFNYTFLDKLYINHNKLSRLPAAIGKLKLLQLLDVSSNRLTDLPPEIGMLTNLKQLMLFDNELRTLPYELGSLYQLEVIGIEGNPLQDVYKTVMMTEGTRALIQQLRDTMPGTIGSFSATPRDIIEPACRDFRILEEAAHQDEGLSKDRFSAISYNILCEKYATTNLYGYVASWALDWNYRKNLIKEQLLESKADILCVQELDMRNFHDYFCPELSQEHYQGIFQPKTRARTMSDSEKKSVDGCATFYNTQKFSMLMKQELEFNTLAIQRDDFKKTADIFNRVMPKDNVAIVCFLENKLTGARLIVANVHLTWDPQYRDVKLVQVAILLEQLDKLARDWKDIHKSSVEGAPVYNDHTQIPLLICGDFNSVADSGVYELLSKGSVSGNHDDLTGRTYGNFQQDGISHPFTLKSAYANVGELKFTNYVPDFTGTIDYIWYSQNSLTPTALLGDVEEKYLATVPGFPNVHFPSDHIMLQSEFLFKTRKEPGAKPPAPNFGNDSGRRESHKESTSNGSSTAGGSSRR